LGMAVSSPENSHKCGCWCEGKERINIWRRLAPDSPSRDSPRMSSPFTNKRGTCEQWIKKGKGAIKWTRLCRFGNGAIGGPPRNFILQGDGKCRSMARCRFREGKQLEFPEPVPWPEFVDGAELLDEIEATFQRFVVCEPAARVALALWSCGTSFEPVAQVAPILNIASPRARCATLSMRRSRSS
jgi:hypothetical protein